MLITLKTQDKSTMAASHTVTHNTHNHDQATLELLTNIEATLISQMENINPAPVTQDERATLFDFLEFAQRYARLIEPTQLFARRITAFLDTIEYMRIQQQHQQQRQRVQVTRIGARRVFADISNEVMQDENIAANLL